MTAIEILAHVLGSAIDPTYTIDEVNPISAASIVIFGHFNPLDGAIEDQLLLTLRTYFRINHVWYTLNVDDDGYLKFSARMTRKPAFVQVKW